MMAHQQISPLAHPECRSQAPSANKSEKVNEVTAGGRPVEFPVKIDNCVIKRDTMTDVKGPQPLASAHFPLSMSNLSHQIDQPISHMIPAPVMTSKVDSSSAKPVSNERLFLRKLSKMIINEQWHEMDEFLRSPNEVAAYRSAVQASRSPFNSFTEGAAQRLGQDVHGVSSHLGNLSLEKPTTDSNEICASEIIHFACRFNPPRTIIRHLSSLFPEGANCPDKSGRLPLHYAVKWGASVRLIYYLLEKDKSAANMQDSLGKTPLHLLCEKYIEAYDPRNAAEISAEDSLVAAVKILVDASPESVNIEDNNGFTPIEYAIFSDSPYKAVRFLQKTSEKDWKDRKKTSMPGEDTHDKIEEKLRKDQQQKQLEDGMNRELRRSNAEHDSIQYDIARLRTTLNPEKSSSSLNPGSLPASSTKQARARSKYAMSA